MEGSVVGVYLYFVFNTAEADIARHHDSLCAVGEGDGHRGDILDIHILDILDILRAYEDMAVFLFGEGGRHAPRVRRYAGGLYLDTSDTSRLGLRLFKPEQPRERMRAAPDEAAAAGFVPASCDWRLEMSFREGTLHRASAEYGSF